MTRTYSPKASEIKREWLIIDATDVVLGRLASHAAALLRGKHKPTYTPHLDTGDYVVVINADKVRLSGRKAEQKTYFKHTGYMGHDRQTPFATMLAKHPERIIEKAVFGMLPKTTLARTTIRKKLRVYPGAEHPHVAQMPQVLSFPKSEAK